MENEMIQNQRSCKLLNCVCSFTLLFFNHFSISRQFALRQSLGELKRSRGGESMCQRGWKRKMCQRKRKRRKLRRKLRRGWSRKKSTGPWYRSPPLDSNHSIFPPHVPVLSCTPTNIVFYPGPWTPSLTQRRDWENPKLCGRSPECRLAGQSVVMLLFYSKDNIPLGCQIVFFRN